MCCVACGYTSSSIEPRLDHKNISKMQSHVESIICVCIPVSGELPKNRANEILFPSLGANVADLVTKIHKGMLA